MAWQGLTNRQILPPQADFAGFPWSHALSGVAVEKNIKNLKKVTNRSFEMGCEDGSSPVLLEIGESHINGTAFAEYEEQIFLYQGGPEGRNV